MQRSHRKDGNHDLVVQAIRRRGYFWWDASQTNLGVDGFAVGHGRLVPVEIKDPKSKRKLALSEHEHKIHTILRRHGIAVELLTGDDQSLDVLTPPARDFYEPRRNADRTSEARKTSTANRDQDPA